MELLDGDAVATTSTDGAAPAPAAIEATPVTKPELKPAQANPKPVKRRRAARKAPNQDPFGFPFGN
jgi:hypothetical protein